MTRALPTAIPLTALVLTTSACSSDPEPDVSHTGQIEYACALAEHVAEDAQIEEWTVIGDEAHAGVRAVASASSLVGGSAAFVLPDHEELSESGRFLFMALNRADPELTQDGLDQMTELCADVSPDSEPDVTEEGQIQFACALAEHLTAEHSEVDSWGGLEEERGWLEVMSLASLVGAANGQVLSEHAELSEAGRQILTGFTRLQTEEIQSGLEDFTEACEEL